MAKFIRVTNVNQGCDIDTILNVDDIGHISIGPNIIFCKTTVRRRDKSNLCKVQRD